MSESRTEVDRLIDGVYKDIGGFGRLQIAGTVLKSVSTFTILTLLMSISYLEKAPTAYLCSYYDDDKNAKMRECEPRDFCEDPNLKSF